VEQITKMGVLPKNVASQTTTIYIFKAHVGQGGSVQTTPANKQQLTDIERAEAKEYKKGMGDSPEDEAIRAQFEAQYGDRALSRHRPGDRCFAASESSNSLHWSVLFRWVSMGLIIRSPYL